MKLIYTKNRRLKKLRREEVASLAQLTASKIDSLIPKYELKEFLKSGLPFTVCTLYTQIWVDRHYVAFSHINDGKIRYVYMDEYHYNDTKSDDLSCEARSGEPLLPDYLRQQFKYASTKIGRGGKNYCLFELGNDYPRY